MVSTTVSRRGSLHEHYNHRRGFGEERVFGVCGGGVHPIAYAALISLNSLSGEIHGTTRALEVEQASVDDCALGARMDDLARGVSSGVWAQATSATGPLSQSGYSAAYYDLGGVMIGADDRIDQRAAVGIALGRSHLDALAIRPDAGEIGAYVWTSGLGPHVPVSQAG